MKRYNYLTDVVCWVGIINLVIAAFFGGEVANWIVGMGGILCSEFNATQSNQKQIWEKLNDTIS